MSTIVDEQVMGLAAVEADVDPPRSRRHRRGAVTAGLQERFGVADATLLRWRRLKWLGDRASCADPTSGWTDPEVVAQIAWLAQIHQMKSGRRVDAADVAAGPALRAARCQYGYRSAGANRWAPIDDVERFVAAGLEQYKALLIARVPPATATTGLGGGR